MTQAALATLREMHPGYEPLVHEFIDRDPLAELRASIDRARAARGAAEAEACCGSVRSSVGKSWRGCVK
jgi:hypothetical protein